jgi:hypothetical protein
VVQPDKVTQLAHDRGGSGSGRRAVLQGPLGLPCLLGRAQASARVGADDEAFLEDLSRRSCQYFIEHAGPTGIVRDRARTDGSPSPHAAAVGSIAATGFGLTALCIAADRGWVSRDLARQRVESTLQTFAAHPGAIQGWFFHFMDVQTGKRIRRSEVSSIDTALLLAGVLTARAYWDGETSITRLATHIVERVDYQWMLAGHPTLLSHGYRPERGFIGHRWDAYSELMLLYVLGLGSGQAPLPTEAWGAWQRPPTEYAGIRYVGRASLFIHQYAHAWIDFRRWRDPHDPYDWYDNSVRAIRAHRQFCLDIAPEFPGCYDDAIWGITASDTPRGYRAWAGPPRSAGIDGTVVPCAAAGSLMFTPDISLHALRAMRDRFGSRVYGRYGFTDAFHPTSGWTNPDVIGIDVGITLIACENLRSGRVWEWFMRNPEITAGLRRAGLSPTVM